MSETCQGIKHPAVCLDADITAYSNLSRSEDAATGYKPGLYAAIACSLLNIILVIIVDTKFFFENRKAERGEKELEADEDVSLIAQKFFCSKEEKLTFQQEIRERGFRYTY